MRVKLIHSLAFKLHDIKESRRSYQEAPRHHSGWAQTQISPRFHRVLLHSLWIKGQTGGQTGGNTSKTNQNYCSRELWGRIKMVKTFTTASALNMTLMSSFQITWQYVRTHCVFVYTHKKFWENTFRSFRLDWFCDDFGQRRSQRAFYLTKWPQWSKRWESNLLKHYTAFL